MIAVNAFSDIDTINHSICSPEMRAIPTGRGYLVRRNLNNFFGVHAGQIHGPTVREYHHGTRLDHIIKTQNYLKDRLYLGFGGFINLSYIAASKSRAAILADINPLQTISWQHIIGVLAAEPTSKGFMNEFEGMPAALTQKFNKIFGPCEVSLRSVCTSDRRMNIGLRTRNPFREMPPGSYWIKDTIKPDRLWLRHGYEHLHDMAKNGAIGALTIDISDIPAWQELKTYLDTKNLKAGIVYTSNIFDYMMARTMDWPHRMAREHRAIHAVGNIARVTQPNITVINSDVDHNSCGFVTRNLEKYNRTIEHLPCMPKPGHYNF